MWTGRYSRRRDWKCEKDIWRGHWIHAQWCTYYIIANSPIHAEKAHHQEHIRGKLRRRSVWPRLSIEEAWVSCLFRGIVVLSTCGLLQAVERRRIVDFMMEIGIRSHNVLRRQDKTRVLILIIASLPIQTINNLITAMPGSRRQAVAWLFASFFGSECCNTRQPSVQHASPLRSSALTQTLHRPIITSCSSCQRQFLLPIELIKTGLARYIFLAFWCL